MSYVCPVCGFTELKRDPEYIGSFEICPSCGFQFRVTDNDQGFTYEQWRKKWIDRGMIWRSNGRKPPKDWDLRKQLLNLPT